MHKKIAIGGDHAGFPLKEKISYRLKEAGFEIKDFGTYNGDSVDYPDYAHTLAQAIENHEFECGILICGSGNGVCMTANKHKGVRAALAWNSDIAALAKQHNNANILCLPGRFISDEDAYKIVDSYLNSDFEGGRHERRVNKIG